MISQLQKVRLLYEPKLPSILQKDIARIACSYGQPTSSLSHKQELSCLFKNTYGLPIASFVEGLGKPVRAMKTGVVLSGGQAPGGHNILCGLYDALQKMSCESQLIGFLGGPSGILENKYIHITQELIDSYRNTGGFDIIGSGRTKLEGEEAMRKALSVANSHKLDALFVVGGDDSNTNAAVLAEYFKDQGSPTVIIGVPKTIDGDLKNEHIEVSFGFDTACKTYSELIGNIARDAMSAQKYWHFIKLMGRSASHIALECALQTQVNITLISEEIEKESKTLKGIVEDIGKVVVERYRKGYAFGLVLIPEGLIEFIPEVKSLIAEINDLLALNQEQFDSLKDFSLKIEWLKGKLSSSSKVTFITLPLQLQAQLVMDRDPHGNVQVSHIETEKLLMLMVEEFLKTNCPELKFNAIGHFFGYEGRCAFPSNFDADYCYSLGYNAAVLAHFGLSGYISNIAKLNQPAKDWVAGGIPLTMMMNLEQRHGKLKPVIKKALVELEGKAFKYFATQRDKWALTNSFVYPGAIQYYGPSAVCDVPTKTLLLESE